MENSSVKPENSLLNLNKDELKDITLLDINYRTVISFSLFEGEIPLLIRLQDIKYRDVRADLNIRGESVTSIESMIVDEGIEILVNIIFSFIEWKAFDIFDGNDIYLDKIKELEENNIQDGYINRYVVDNEIEKMKNELIYNFRMFVIDRASIDTGVQNELKNIYNKIKNIQSSIINEFTEVLDNIMKYDDEKNINFTEYFTIMLKSSIINNSSTIFPENLGKAYVDYSFREIKLRLAFEHKETMLNANKMKMSIPLFAKSSLF